MDTTDPDNQPMRPASAAGPNTLERLHMLTSLIDAATDHAHAAVNSGGRISETQAFEMSLQSTPQTSRELMSLWATLTIGALVVKREYEETESRTPE